LAYSEGLEGLLLKVWGLAIEGLWAYYLELDGFTFFKILFVVNIKLRSYWFLNFCLLLMHSSWPDEGAESPLTWFPQRQYTKMSHNFVCFQVWKNTKHKQNCFTYFA